MKKKISYRKIASLLVILAIFFLATVECHARVGGGGGFSGGSRGRGSGGSSGGGDLYLIFQLLRLAFHYPLIGVPVLGVVIFIFYKSGTAASSQYKGGVIRKGISAKSQNELSKNIHKICQRDTTFDPRQFENRIKNCFYKLQQFWTDNELEKIRPFVSDGTYERFSILNKIYEFDRFDNITENVNVHSCRIVGVDSTQHFDTIHLKITASASDYFLDCDKGRKVSGSKNTEMFTEYWSFLRRPGAKTLSKSGLLEGFCPNCGTSLKISDSTKCGSCKAVITSGEYDWVLTEITQAEAWIAPVPKAIEGLDSFQEKDPAFCSQFMEDRASTIFWALKYSEFSGNSKILERFATKHFIRDLDIGLQPDQSRTFYADSAIGSVELVEVTPATDDEFDRARVKIVWSGHKETAKISRRILPNYQKSMIYSQEYVLKRHKGVTTPAGNSLLSMHCPNCGAPATEKTGSACEYCQTSFVDGSRDWVLEHIGRFSGYPTNYRHERKLETSTAYVPPAKTLTLDPENLLSAVITVMLADDVIDPKEQAALNKLAQRLSYPVESLNSLIAGVRSKGFQAQVPSCPQESKLFMKELVRMALADGNICRRELNLLKSVSSKIGYIDADIDLLVKRVKSELYQEAKKVLRNRK